MTIKKMRINSVELTPENIEGIGGIDFARDGELGTDSSDNELKVRLNSITETIVTEDQTQVLINKTIDADLNTIVDLEVDNLKSGVLNVSTTLTGASDTQLPSALAVKTYIDDKAAAQNEADEISYDPTTSGLVAVNVQAAIDEVDFDLDATQLIVGDHIADTTDAHDASAISNIPTGNLAATDVQAALNELQGDIDTNTSGISNHISDTTDAHDASSISNIPSGNLVATDVQSALDELQSEVDTKGDAFGPASSTDNAIARFDLATGKLLQNSVVTVSDAGVIAGSSIDADTNTITNIENADIKAGAAIDASKIADGSVSSTEFQYLSSVSSNIQDQLDAKVDETGGTIINPARLDAKQDTLANLYTYALTATDGQFVWATDTKETYVVKDSTLSSVGGGSGSLDSIFQLTASEQISGWSTGDNAAFLGGGTLAGTFVKETVNPLNGISSYKYTQAAGSLDDYLASPVQAVPVRFRGNIASFSFAYKYDGLNVDIEPVIYDVTNSTKLNSTADLLSGISTTAGIYKINVTIPLSCTSIRVGFQVKALNSGKILQFDDLQLSADATVYADPSTITEHQNYTPTITGFGTVSSVNIRSRRVGSNLEIIGTFVTGTPDGSAASLSFPTGLLSSSNISALENAGSLAGASAAANRLYVMTRSPSTSVINFAYRDLAQTDTVFSNTVGVGISSGSGQILQVNATIPIQGWSASNPQIITPTDQISSDTLSFVFKATAIDPATDAIGTFNTYTYASSSNAATISASAPTQTTNSMNIDGVQVFARAFNAASTTASPARFEVFIGKGLKSTSLSLFKSTLKTTTGSFDLYLQDSNTVVRGFSYQSYNETTGILTLDVGYDPSGNGTTRQIAFDDNTNQTNGYVVFNAAKSPSLVSHPSLIQRIATLSDEKANNTDGGTSIAGWNTRDLNTENDPDSIVSLSANQFTLQAGRYYIVGRSPVLQGDRGKVRLRNITLGTTALVGESFYVPGGSGVMGTPEVKGTITITSATVFELQHYLTTGIAGVGLGYSTTSAGEVELYSTVEITQLK
jgi:hypothetical protein